MSASASVALLERLVAFDTTSRNSNLELIEFVRGYLEDLDAAVELVFNEERSKANLFATLGPTDRPGVVLSGHTDVVPVDGQDWHSNPFRLSARADRLYGRGTADMKGFIAVCLALAPEFAARTLHTPVHFAFSYDEEVGCLGVRDLLSALARRPVRPQACVIGEPTGMQVIRAHKGKLSLRCHVHGVEGHSSLPQCAVNAVEAAAETVAYMTRLARQRREQGPFDTDFSPPYTTIHTGTMQGGTALNIVPGHCQFDFEFRHLPGDDPQALLQVIQDYVARELLPDMHAVSASAGFTWEHLARLPALDTPEDAAIVRLAKQLAGANAAGKVSFGTEGGFFHEAGIPSVICGPGHIEQAHKPDEYIELSQLTRCETFVRRLLGQLAIP